MIQPPRTRLAALNVGRLLAPARGGQQCALNLTVRESPATPKALVWNTVRCAFCKRLGHLRDHGDTDHAFGWKHLTDARLWKDHACAQVAGAA